MISFKVNCSGNRLLPFMIKRLLLNKAYQKRFCMAIKGDNMESRKLLVPQTTLPAK
jgi:hypothetical protein